MKKNILILLVCVLSFSAINAQGNLQFNQVINQSFSLIDNGNFQTLSIGTIVVPAGKVYKIESATMMANISGRLGGLSRSASIGDQLFWLGTNSANNVFPLWLSEGSYPVQFLNLANGTSYEYRMSFSAIEFNIIP